jgi:hypothetical protein
MLGTVPEKQQRINKNLTKKRDALDNGDNNNWQSIRTATTTRIPSQQGDEISRPSTSGRRTTLEKISALQQRIDNMGINEGAELVENTEPNNQRTIQFSTTVQANDRWGDDISSKKDGTSRLYFQNINSMGLPKPDKCRNILNCLTIKNFDIVRLAETCADWKDKTLSHLVRMEAQAVAKHVTLAFSENRTISESTYLPVARWQQDSGAAGINTHSTTTEIKGGGLDSNFIYKQTNLYSV